VYGVKCRDCEVVSLPLVDIVSMLFDSVSPML